MNDDRKLLGHEEPGSDTSEKPEMAPIAIAGQNGVATNDLPTVLVHGTLPIGDIEIPAFVLSDERRVLSGRGVTGALALTGRGQGMARFAEAKYLEPYIGEALKEALLSPIRFAISPGLPVATGYLARILPELCNAILDANEARALRPDQTQMAVQAKALSRAFSVVGIEALVDEATGYQYYRDRDALNKILQQYLHDERGVWAKRFPDEFYQEMFRLRGWQYSHLKVAKPSYVGKLTNDLVYSRLAPNILDKLRELVPRDEKGHLQWHFHQHLTEDVGLPELDKHIHAITHLMKATTSWRKFQTALERSFPLKNTTLLLAYELPEEREDDD